MYENLTMVFQEDVVQLYSAYPKEVAAIIGLTALIFVVMVYKSHVRRKLRLLLYSPFPCSRNQLKFPKAKSFYDILVDMGISLQSFQYIDENLNWIPANDQLEHFALDNKVQCTLENFSSYGEFINQSKNNLHFKLDDLPAKEDKEIQFPIKGGTKIPENPRIQEFIEARNAFSNLIVSLRDEAKVEVAKRLGLVHRFDYLSTEMFRELTQNKERSWTLSLDFKTHRKDDLIIALSALSGTVGGTLWGVSQLGELAGTAEAAEGLTAGENMDPEAMGECGEDMMELALVGLVLGGAWKFVKNFKHRHLRKYQEELKVNLEKLTDVFIENGDERGLMVPKLIIHAFEIEKERLKELLGHIKSHPIRGRKRSHYAKFANLAVKESLKVTNLAAKKFNVDMSKLLKRIMLFNQGGRPDIVGVMLYWNKDLIFLPSQVSPELIEKIEISSEKVFKEIQRLKSKV